MSELFRELFSDDNLIDIPEAEEGVEAALKFCEEVTQYNEYMWAAFLAEAQQDTAEIQTSIDSELKMLTLKLQEDLFKPSFHDDLQINFSIATFANEKTEKEFDYGVLDGMSREFTNTKEIAALIKYAKETLLKIPEVLAKVDEKIKAKEDEETEKEAIKERMTQ